MGYKLRHLPGPELVEITSRAIQRRFLLRPSPLVNAIIIGALARAQRRYGMKVCYCVYLSNHAHLLLWPDNAQHMANFMRYAHSKIAKELGRIHHWRGGLFEHRYTSIPLSEEPELQIVRLRYLLSQGCKEGLVASPRHWPGVTAVKALTKGESLDGIWIDRTGQYRARECGRDAPDREYTTPERLEITPLPCWHALTEPQRQTKVRTIIREIEEEAGGTRVLGRQAILRQDPHAAPKSHPPRTPAPRFHAIESDVRRALEWAFRILTREYQQAAQDLALGREAVFPSGCFLPAGRFLPLTT